MYTQKGIVMVMLVEEVMTGNPVCLSPAASIAEAAATMRDNDVGDIFVVDDQVLVGVITDRDIVVRAVADSKNTDTTKLGTLASTEPVYVSPRTPASQAAQTMREHGIRRLAVCDGDGRPVGAVSLGDLAVHKDPDSALADISAEFPNR